MSAFSIGCDISSSDYSCELGLEIWLDDQLIFDRHHVLQAEKFSCEISDQEAQHCLKFVMKGKKPEHTQIDAAGNIIKDARLILSREMPA